VREILFVAGETSGDLHAASVAHELTALAPPFTLRGIGGDLMQAAGVRLDEHIRDFAVLGLIEVLRHVPKHWRTLRALRARIRSGSVALVVLVDYPGFNMRVAEAAAEADVPVLYYIVPQVWAWGEDRLERMARWIRKAAVILPFEEPLLRDHGVDATFVGHPLLDRAAEMPSREEARDRLGLPRDARVLALFPGSRAQEIERHLKPFVRTAELLRAADPSLHVIVSAAPHVRIDESRCSFPLVHSASLTVLRSADAAMCKSGTTTLEAAVAGCPLVVAYRAHPVTYFAARRLVRIPNIGLVNVVAGRQIAPEFVQNALVPSAVARVLAPLIVAESPERQRMVAELDRVRGMLGQPGAARRVAAIARNLAEGRPA
jgi:lipid-A-disaccharide synthase